VRKGKRWVFGRTFLPVLALSGLIISAFLLCHQSKGNMNLLGAQALKKEESPRIVAPSLHQTVRVTRESPGIIVPSLPQTLDVTQDQAYPMGAPPTHTNTPFPLRNEQAISRAAKEELFLRAIIREAKSSSSLFDYLIPSPDNVTTDVNNNWVPFLAGCKLASDCYCFHVNGSMSKSVNPSGWKNCYRGSHPDAHRCKAISKDCSCLIRKGGSEGECLFSDMRPGKLLAVAAAARLAGVTHIIEEGRFGGLSALVYNLLGFKVTSVEFLPLQSPTAALKLLAPEITIIDGDGSIIIPDLISRMNEEEQSKTLVMFDGEKRFEAFETYNKIKNVVGLAVFDDTGTKFIKFIENQGIYFDTRKKQFAEFVRNERHVCSKLLKPLRDWSKLNGKIFTSGVDRLEQFHLGIIVGGGFKGKLDPL